MLQVSQALASWVQQHRIASIDLECDIHFAKK